MSRVLVESGIEWIGKYPAEWNLSPLRGIVDNINEKNNPIKFTNVLSLTNKLGVVPYEEKGNLGNISKEDISQYKIAYKDTVIINSMNLKIGSVGYSNYDGCVSPVYYVLKNNEKSDISFINYIFQSNFQKYLGKYGKGILEIREKISMYDILHSYIPVPSFIEQKRIASYLDKICTKIDEITSDNNREIELLEEYKNNIILDKVCHGLDYSEFKIINIDSIDKIPVTWGLTRLKYYISIFNGKDCNKNSDSSKIPVYGSGGVFSYTDDYLYDGESLLLGRKGTIDKPIIVNGKFWTVDTMFYSIPKRECNLKYIYYFMKTLNWDKYIFGTALPSMTQSILNEIKIPFLSLDEQNKIVDYLDKQCAKLDCVIDYRKRIIEKLEEYKRSLIYECVTGKREV